MSYGNYSEVYLAIEMQSYNKQENIIVKIGETINSRQRSHSLERDKNVTIVRWCEVGGTKAYRMWIEGCLRLYIEDNFNCYRIGTDTFVFRKREEAEEIITLFDILVGKIMSSKMF